MNNKKRKKLPIPRFKSEDKERAFWSRATLNRYVDKGEFVRAAFPNLKPSSASISVRIPRSLLVRLKERANSLDVPYQSLMKEYIARGVSKDE